MTGLDAFRQRGWCDNDDVSWGIGLIRANAAFAVEHFEDETEQRMAVAAALVAEGHDPVQLIRDWWEADRHTPALRARIRALLAAAGEQP